MLYTTYAGFPSLFRARSPCPKRDFSTGAAALLTFPEKHFSFLLTAISSEGLFRIHVFSIVAFTFRNCFVCDWEYKGECNGDVMGITI